MSDQDQDETTQDETKNAQVQEVVLANCAIPAQKDEPTDTCTHTSYNNNGRTTKEKLGLRYVLELRPNDVLLGRGTASNDHRGNIQFRDVVAARKAEYTSTSDRQAKAQIASQVVETVLSKEGRFLRTMTPDEAVQEGYLNGGVDSGNGKGNGSEIVSVYACAEEATILEKAKQALRQSREKGASSTSNAKSNANPTSTAAHSPLAVAVVPTTNPRPRKKRRKSPELNSSGTVSSLKQTNSHLLNLSRRQKNTHNHYSGEEANTETTNMSSSDEEPCHYEEIKLTCKDGIELSGRRYRSSNTDSSITTSTTGNANTNTNSRTSTSTSTNTSPPPDMRILCWHGWLDNCASFTKLAPALVEQLPGNVDLVAVDFPGHGYSFHKSLDGPPMLLMDYVYYVYDVVQQLHWQDENLTLIGHSMGAAVSLMYAATFPVHQLVLLDALGPQVTPGVAKSLREHCKTRLKGKAPSSIYNSLTEAVDTRTLTAKAFPGNQYISKEAAKALVEGASTVLPDGRLQFLHDQRLKMRSILYLCQDQVDELYKEVGDSSCATCLLLADDGMPFESSKISHVRDLLSPKLFETLPGSHHFHMDASSAEGVAKAVVSFLTTS
jgi:pimeloyl-ACP methyl ester carboxylesterase